MINLVGFLVILSILIIAHEFGHFIMARKSGVRVEKFAIGFGPPLFKKKGKTTEFLFCLFPLGGFVKLAGDSHDDRTGAPDEFLSKPVGTKIKIVFFGPLFNYLLAFIMFWIMAVVGLPYTEPVIGKILSGYPAEAAGLREGDRVLEVNGNKVDNWTRMADAIGASKEKVSLKIERAGETLMAVVFLKGREITDDFGRKRNASMIGISSTQTFKIRKYNFFIAFFKGLEALINMTVFVVKGFIFMILGIVPFRDAVAGPLGIYYITSEAIKLGIIAILHLMATLNVSLAIVNLLPLPILDGGHMFIFLLEKIRKRSLSEKAQDIITRVGIAFMAVLFIFIFYNDFVRFGSKIWGK